MKLGLGDGHTCYICQQGPDFMNDIFFNVIFFIILIFGTLEIGLLKGNTDMPFWLAYPCQTRIHH